MGILLVLLLFGMMCSTHAGVLAAGAGRYTFFTEWGMSLTEGYSFMDSPSGVAVDANGMVYVADSRNNRIKKFDSNGTFLTTWGSSGSGNGQFDLPNGITVDASGNVYVADSDNHRIQKFDSNGAFLTAWGSEGSGNGQFDSPNGITVDASGNVYVVDGNNNRIQKFDSTGAFLTTWGSYGSGNGQLHWAGSIAVDSTGTVYVADSGNNRIQRFDSNGTFLTTWGSYGTGNGQFSYPESVAVDSSGTVYVADTGNDRIQKFDSNGTFLTAWGSYGSGNGQFSYPESVAVDSSGTVYVADRFNHRIQKFMYVTAPTITSGMPASGSYGTAYRHTFTTDGAPAPTFSVSNGSLPPGLTLNATTGELDGTPTQIGTFTFTIQASNSEGSGSQAVSLIIAPTAPTLTITSATTGKPGSTFAFTAQGFTPGTQIIVSLGTWQVGTLTVGPEGTVAFAVTFSTAHAPGNYTIVIEGQGSTTAQTRAMAATQTAQMSVTLANDAPLLPAPTDSGMPIFSAGYRMMLPLLQR